MDIRPIRTQEDYDAACKRIDEIFHAEPGTPEDDEHVHIKMPHPIEMIKMQMDALQVNSADLARHLGESTENVSDILDCRRPLTLHEVRIFNKVLRIPAETLLQEYPLPHVRRDDDTMLSVGA